MADPWPEAISLSDNHPKDGFCRIHLKAEELKVSNSLFSAAQAKNATVKTELKPKFIKVEVQFSSGKEYSYIKDLVEPIKETKSEVKLKDGYVVLTLCKEKDVSWAAYEPDLTTF